MSEHIIETTLVLVSISVQCFSQWESVPAGSEEVTEMVDFWLVSAGGASADAGSTSTSASLGDTLREKEANLVAEKTLFKCKMRNKLENQDTRPRSTREI